MLASAIDALIPPVAAVCHDAGAANLTIAWLAHFRGELRGCMAGPAAALWDSAFPGRARVSIDAALDGAATLLSGTGWSSDMEHVARREARLRGMCSIAVIDHWVNYEERFIRDGERVLPDEVWVADAHARAEAIRRFPEIAVRELPNLYLERLAAEVEACSPQAPRQLPAKVLYVLEPIRQRWGDDPQSGELQAFEYFLEHLREKAPGAAVRLRPHPSDPPDKYDSWPTRFPEFDLLVDAVTPLAKQIAEADWIVGCESFALVIAMRAGRIVISSQPPWAPRSRLPQEELIHLRDFVPAR